MNFQIILVLLIASVQVACCSRTFSYPVMANVSRIEVTNGQNIPVKEIKSTSQISNILKFIDERRERWCSPRFGSIPQAKSTLNFHREENGQSVIRVGNLVLVVELAEVTYKMDISDAEQKEFLELLGISQEELFK